MQPQSLSLRETLGLVVPHQSALDLCSRAAEDGLDYRENMRTSNKEYGLMVKKGTRCNEQRRGSCGIL